MARGSHKYLQINYCTIFVIFQKLFVTFSWYFQSFVFTFYQTCQDGNIKEGEVKNALDVMGLKIPNHEVREILNDLKSKNKMSGDELTKEQFKEVNLKYQTL